MSATSEDSLVDSLTTAKRLVLAMLSQDRQPTDQEVDDAVNAVFGMLTVQGKCLDRDLLAKEIEAMTAIFQERSAGLDDDSDEHVPWLSEAKNERDWAFWERYRRYLEDVRGMPPWVVRRLDQTTDEVLGQLENPQRQGTWRRTGLVIGQVQSGKTSQYIGLAAKAVDAGYRLIVVLAGIHNDLRSQTQLRIDEGLLGFDTQFQMRSSESGKSRLMGAGKMPFARKLDIASPTNSSEKGDFGKQAANTVNFPLGRFPVVLVIKKHHQILAYLRKWVTEVHGTVDENGRAVVRDVPLFIIDDEADNASINTAREPEADPTKTNKAIRELVNSFDKAAYVGYTATPFANIYIDPETRHAELGADLFPESFIRTLPAPSNYLGPERVFGLKTDADEEDVPPLPLIRHVDDADRWLPAKHKSRDVPASDLPGSLRKAIASFVLACAARRARGQTRVHNSMLVHVTRFTGVQELVTEQVDDHLRLMIDTLRDRHGKGSEQMKELQNLWERDFVPTTERFTVDEAERLSWEHVSKQVLPAIRRIKVKTVNGASHDALEYFENRRSGLSVIAVGGEKLSRGLTLEGLTVSYYLRASKTYDTLLQMGRWFGYRPGYEDLCRLYTTPTLEAAYVEVTGATNELIREIEEMAALNLTPKEFGLKVRSSSLGLAVTAANKMRRGTKVLLSYSGQGPESVIFNLSSRCIDGNFNVLENLVRRLDAAFEPEELAPGGRLVWRGVNPDLVTSFLTEYETDRMAQTVRPRFIAKYIEQCRRVGELGNWTVCLVGRSGFTHAQKIGGHTVGLVTRNPLNKETYKSDGRYTIRRILSPPDEMLDLDEKQKDAARELSRRAAARKEKPAPKNPSGEHIRWQRRPDQALLLIYPIELRSQGIDTDKPLVGFQVSFPHSEHQSETEYVVNQVWFQEDIYTNAEGDEE